MRFCPNCGTQYEAIPIRCQCGYLFASEASTPQPNFTEPAAPTGKIEFTGSGGDLLVLYLKLIVFSILTLGIYSFWGRVEVRKYIWRNLRLAGQPFSFHGTGKEMFLGWLLLGVAVAAIYGAGAFLYVLLGEQSAYYLIPIFVLIGALVVPFAIHGAIRYRASRTEWMGRRFEYRGDLFALAGHFWKGLLLTIFTLTIYAPVFYVSLRGYVLNHLHYGGQQLSFNGTGRELIWPYVKFLLLFPFTLGLSRFWYIPKQNNYCWEHTRFAGAPFRSTMTGLELFVMTLFNGMLTVVTLGIAYPWAICRKLRFVANNVSLAYLPEVQLANPAVAQQNAFGEQVEGALGGNVDLGAGFGL